MAAGDIKRAKQLYKINFDKLIEENELEDEEDEAAVEIYFLTAAVSALAESVCEYADGYDLDRTALLEDCVLSLRKFLLNVDLDTLEYCPTGMYVDPDEPRGPLS